MVTYDRASSYRGDGTGGAICMPMLGVSLEPLVTVAQRGSTTLSQPQTPQEHMVPGQHSVAPRCKEMPMKVLRELVSTAYPGLWSQQIPLFRGVL